MICKFGFGGMMEMRYIAKDIPLWQVTIWDKKFNNVDKKWQPKTIKYKYLLSDELDSLRVDDGDVRILYTGKDVGFTTEELAGDRLSEGEIISIPWGGIPTVKYHKGKFVTGDNRIATSNDIDKLTNKYLYYFMRGNIHEIASYYRGASLKHPCMKDILKMTISYPSVQEQDKICGQFDVLEQIIEVRKQELQLLDDLIKARFIELFGDPKVNPKQHPVSALSEYIEFLTSGSRGWAKYCTDDGNEWFITIKNVKDCRISIDNMQPVNAPDNAEARRTKVQEGDLLISITADLGRTGVVTKEIAEHGAYINQHLTCIRLNKEILNPLYVAHFMESAAGKEQFESKNQSVVKAGLNFNSINSLRIMVPPMSIQEEFISFVAEVDKSKLKEHVLIQITL